MAEQQPPMTLSESAIGLHEFFISLQAAGFTEEQAMYLVAEMLGAAAQGNVDYET